MSGIATAFSHLDTDCAPIPSFSASCSCVSPALNRSCLIFFPSSITFTSSKSDAFDCGFMIQRRSPEYNNAERKVSRLLVELKALQWHVFHFQASARTFLPSCLNLYASFAIRVVLPAPFTPVIK